jgi:PHD/YefM family antitoxin component YafN of YafNO toxin-antitoxin module
MSTFSLDEVVAARDAARGFSALLEKLRSAQAMRFVIVFRNRPQAVLLHVAEYERLVSASHAHEQPAA